MAAMLSSSRLRDPSFSQGFEERVNIHKRYAKAEFSFLPSIDYLSTAANVIHEFTKLRNDFNRLNLSVSKFIVYFY